MRNPVLILLKKDLLLELRQQHTFFGIILYVAATIFVLFLSMDAPAAETWNSLFWVIQLFVCVNTVAKSFLQESKSRMLYFFSISSPVSFIISKLLYNIILMILMSCISLMLFFVFLNNPVSNVLRFTGIVLIGGASLSIVFTLMSAIAAKAQQNSALMAILGFPIILPQLLLLMRLSKSAFSEVFKAGAVLQLCGLIIGLDLLIIVLAIILFPYLWKD